MSIICCKCGGTNISCEAMVNPNTKEFVRYTDEPLVCGWCSSCSEDQALTDTEKVKAAIDKAFIEHKSTFTEEPLYALCQIAYIGTDDIFVDVLIKLSADMDDKEDDDVFFFCNGIEDLKSLAELSANDFIVVGFNSFLKFSTMKKILICIKLFHAMAKDLFEAIHGVDSDELNAIIEDGYPFDKSLDEICIDIINWSEKIVSKLNASDL